jgi:hypothetical protein
MVAVVSRGCRAAIRTASARIPGAVDLVLRSGGEVECLRVRVSTRGCSGVLNKICRVAINLWYLELGISVIPSIDCAESIPGLTVVGCGRWSIHFAV